MDLNVIGIRVLGAVAPMLLWLWFWLREDSKHPEPRRLIALAFVAGMICVAISIPLELWVQKNVTDNTWVFNFWAAIEETVKFALAYITVLRRAEDDEPIDPVIYMITVALGFAAAENALFLISPKAGDTILQVIETGNLRSVGASLLHVLSSAMIGIALGLAFYKPARIKIFAATCGLALAIVLHAAFNHFILATNENDVLKIFGAVWIGLVILIAILEYIKRIRK